MKALSNEFMQHIAEDEAWKDLSGELHWTESMLEKYASMYNAIPQAIEGHEQNAGLTNIMATEQVYFVKASWDLEGTSNNGSIRIKA